MQKSSRNNPNPTEIKPNQSKSNQDPSKLKPEAKSSQMQAQAKPNQPNQAPKPAKATLVWVGNLTVVECLLIQI